MKISYKPLWKTLADKNMSKRDLRLQAHLTTSHIANMGKEYISGRPTLTLRHCHKRRGLRAKVRLSLWYFQSRKKFRFVIK